MLRITSAESVKRGNSQILSQHCMIMMTSPSYHRYHRRQHVAERALTQIATSLVSAPVPCAPPDITPRLAHCRVSNAHQVQV